MTHSDLMYSMLILSRYLSNSEKEHLALLKNVFCYMSGTLDIGLTFMSEDTSDIIGFTDSDFTGAVNECKSTGGFVFMLAGGCISHQSKWQAVVALLSCESKYMAMSETGKEALWMRWFLKEVGYRKRHLPIVLHADNQGAIALAKNPHDNHRSKHIHVWYHWIRNHINDGNICLKWVPTADMAADGFTKALPAPAFTRFRKLIGLAQKGRRLKPVWSTGTTCSPSGSVKQSA